MFPAQLDPGDVAADHAAEQDRAGDIEARKDESGVARSMAEGDGGDHSAKGGEREGGLDGGAEGGSSDAAIGRLQEVLKLGQQDGEAEVEDDPFGVVAADMGQLQEAGCRQKVERATEKTDH